MGGLVVLVGFGAVMLLGLAGTTELSATHELFSVTPLTGCWWGADLRAVRAVRRSGGHAGALEAAAPGGGRGGGGGLWGALGALEGLLGPELLWATQGLTAAFLVAGVNAINLMDGLDGLAGDRGAGLLGDPAGVGAARLGGAGGGLDRGGGAGAVLGFLLHNRHPARVFLGTAGRTSWASC